MSEAEEKLLEEFRSRFRAGVSAIQADISLTQEEKNERLARLWDGHNKTIERTFGEENA